MKGDLRVKTEFFQKKKVLILQEQKFFGELLYIREETPEIRILQVYL